VAPPRVPPPQQADLLTADGVAVHAVHSPPRTGADGGLAVVVVHGFTGSAASPPLCAVADRLSAHCGVVALDLRGHGRSGGASTLGDAEVADVAAAASWASALGYDRVATLGFSLGGAVVIRHAALRGGVAAVAAVSAPARWYYRGTAPMRLLHLGVLTPTGRLVARFRGTRVARRGWDPPPVEVRRVVGALRAPLLVVHGDADGYLPMAHAREIAAAAPGCTLWEVAGLGHAEAALPDPLVDRIGRWLVLASTAPDAAAPPGVAV